MSDETITVGRSEVRKDAWDKVVGAAQYVADIPMQGVKAGLVLRSTHHHARLVSVDTARAKALPGVLAVVTAEDIPGAKLFGPIVEDRPPLATQVVRHVGEPIAIVVAETQEIARRALDLIQVEYEPLPAVFDPVQALESNALHVHPGGNLLTNYDIYDGDLQSGFAQADVVIEESFYVPRVSPAYLEPEVAMAQWGEDETLNAWVSSQKPFYDGKDIARVLGLPQEKVRVFCAVVGGAFGGREDSGIAILAALAAWAIKGTVRLVNTRQESFVGHPKRHPAHLRYKVGAKQDGTLVALEAIIHLDTGAYASYGPAVGGLLTEVVPGAYRIPNVRVNTRIVYTNSPFSGAMRGFGSPQAHFATECLLDILADRLGMSPLELRRKNVLRPGDRLFTRVVIGDTANALPITLDHAESAMRRLRQIPPSPGKLSGVGMAMCTQSMGYGNRLPDDSTNRLEWLPDGRVLVYLGAPELGQGLQTVVEQIVAEELGLPYEQVITAGLDTHITPDGGVSCASRMTYMVGNSVKQAAIHLVESLLNYAADATRQPRQNFSYSSGKVHLPSEEQISLEEFTARAAEQGVHLQGEATFSFPYPVETTPQHLPIGMPHVMFCYGAQVARVEVDPDLGMVEVKDLVAIHDVGRIINKAGVEGQIEGGVAMGIGYALYEEVALKTDGHWVDSFTEYLLPTSLDVPARIESIILEVPEASGPFGAKGVAEMGTVPTAPAIANAVFDATGVRVKSIPIRPEMLVRNLISA